jgi:homoserine dehydrogenase
LKLALIGYGNVGQAFARLIKKKKAQFPFKIVGIHTTRGTAIDEKGLPLEPVLGAPMKSVEEFLEAAAPAVVFELTPLNPESGQPAISHIRAAFANGCHVVTANKGPVAFAYHELRDEAIRAGVHFRYESVTMDGTPIYNLVRNTLPGVEILGFAGALNSTSKVVLEAMQRGLSIEDGIKEAQKLGVAEADPWFDLDGWDSAAKAAALANVLMDARTTPQQVDRKGISRVTPEKLAELAAKGKTIVLISRARRTVEGVKLRVRAEVLPADDILAAVRGTSNLLVLETDLMGEIGVFAFQPGVDQTAYGLFSDLIDIAKSV